MKQLENKIAEVKSQINYLKQRKQNTANQQLENLINGVNTHSTSTAFERLEQKVKELEKPTHREDQDHSSHTLNEPKPNQNPENILETAIQETQKIIEQSILNRENLKKQLIEQETTLKILNQNLINLKRLKGKLTNRSSEVSTLDSDSEVNSKLDKLFDFGSNVDDELELLLQELRKSHE